MQIARIETFPFTYQTVGWFKFFQGPGGQAAGRPSVIVKITADNGCVGWGQSVPAHRWSYETLETVQSTIEKYLAPELIGLDPFDEEGIRSAMNSVIANSFSTGQPICKAGVDLALFDLTGKLLGQTAAQRWKRNGRTKIALSWTLNPRTLDEVPTLIEQGRARGYEHFNVKIAPNPKFDLELCRLTKELAPNGFLWADANGGFDEKTALEIAPKLADLGVAVFEQPLPANRLTGYRRLVEQGALPIIMDEGIVSAVELEEFIKLKLLNGVAMKCARCGGITEARRVLELALDAGLMFLGSGLTDPDISLAASVLLYGAYDLQFPAALNGPQFLQGTLLQRPFEVRAGQVAVAEGPGLGIEINESRLSVSSAITTPIEVAAALVFRDGKLLITQRHTHVHLGGFWEFPGGKREPNETFEQCLVRELREELGIEVVVGALVESVTHEYPEKVVHLRFFRCAWRECEPQLLGCSALRWVSMNELKQYAFPEADAQLLDKLTNAPELWKSSR